MTGDRAAALDSARGWAVVAAGTVVLVLVWGTVFTFTVYADALARGFGLSDLRTSGVFSAMTAAFYVAGGGLGVVVARLPLRPVVAGAGLLLAGATALLQVAGGYPLVLAAFGLVGAASGTLFVVVVSLVPQWFDAHRGRATGVTLAGNGLGVLLLSPAWVWLLARTGIRGAFAVVGGAAALAVLAASAVCRRPPGAPDDRAPPEVDAAWLRARLADRRFLAALVGYALLWGWYFALSADLVGVLNAAGVGRALAATAFGTIGGLSVLARVLGGDLGDRVGERAVLTGGVLLAALGLLLLLLADVRAVLYGTLVVFGAGNGALAALFSPVILGRFGPANAAAIVGLFTVFEASTAFLVPVALSAAVRVTGGYALPLVGLSAVTLLGVGLFRWGTAPVEAG